MPARIVVWLLVSALAGTAVSAILALVMPGADIAWRFTGTGGLLAAGCLALLPAVRSWESERPSLFSRVATASIGTAMAIGLMAIWSTTFGRSGFDAERLWATDLLLGGWLLLSWLPLRLFGIPKWKWPAGIALAMVSLGFLFFAAEVLRLWTGDEARRGFVLLGFAPLMGTLALPSPADRRSIWTWGRWIGIPAAVAAIATLMIVLPLVWSDPVPSGEIVRTVIALTSIAVTVAVGLALDLAKGPPWKVWIHRLTIGTVALEGVLVTLSVDGVAGADVTIPLGLVAIVGLVTAVLLDAVGRMAERKRQAVASLAEVRLACPRCGKSQAVALDRLARCDRCGLGIEVRVRQDECLRCGYPRFGLPAGADCPECGAPEAEGRGSEARTA